MRFDFPKGAEQFADGEKFRRRVETAGKTFEYSTTLGAKARVKVYRLAGSGKGLAPLTKKQFVAQLREGKSWTVTVTKITSKCFFCNGSKVVNGQKCPQCKGTGGDATVRSMTIRW